MQKSCYYYRSGHYSVRHPPAGIWLMVIVFQCTISFLRSEIYV